MADEALLIHVPEKKVMPCRSCGKPTEVPRDTAENTIVYCSYECYCDD